MNSRAVQDGLFRILMASLCSGCATTFDAASPAGSVHASNAFGFDLFDRIRSQAPTSNVACSPAGASIALMMTAAGAQSATRDEMLRVLHVEPGDLTDVHRSYAALLASVNESKGDSKLVVVDKLWGQEEFEFKSDFVALLRDLYRAPLGTVDFMGAPATAARNINQWASDQTHGLIPQIFDSLSEDTRLVLTNAVYLDGHWTKPFHAGGTHQARFVTPAGTVEVPTMVQVDSFAYAHLDDVKIVELAYSGHLSMVVVLPDAVHGLGRAEDRLAQSHDRWLTALATSKVDLRLPRWTTDSSFNLNGLLQAMGIKLAFEKESADFSAMADRRLAISHVLQKARVETQEEGSRAAAVTVVDLAMNEAATSGPEPLRPIPFHADHPFLYLIRDRTTGLILFAGHVTDPRS
jgi:serpin B